MNEPDWLPYARVGVCYVVWLIGLALIWYVGD